MNTTSVPIKTALSDIEFIRRLAKLFLIMGDDVRPIVQKPVIAKFIGLQPIKHALDAGCGRGLYTRILLQRAAKVTALDYSANCVDAMQRRLGHLDQLSLHRGSADNLPFANEQFDVVTHCEVLEHINDDRKVLSELYRVLEPGGRLIISVPVPPAPIVDHEHVREGYTFEQITTLLEEAGFEVLRHQYCMFSWSRRLIKFQEWWMANVKLPLPTVILLPLYWERYFGNQVSESNLPYDIVLETRKLSGS
jgi:ubiquinone/menaquinone biosynthesis C-methylase UbiE